VPPRPCAHFLLPLPLPPPALDLEEEAVSSLCECADALNAALGPARFWLPPNVSGYEYAIPSAELDTGAVWNLLCVLYGSEGGTVRRKFCERRHSVLYTTTVQASVHRKEAMESSLTSSPALVI
jgi:hypothetical protein